LIDLSLENDLRRCFFLPKNKEYVEVKIKILEFLKKYGEVLFVFFVFILLLARNPFSNRTLIANLEPYPDSFHYVDPALNFIKGKGLYIDRGFGKVLPTVPFLYATSLMPGYLINSDVRMFYFANVLFAFVSLGLFWLILQEVFSGRRFLRFFLLFLFATNYIFYWFPELAMAENLLIPLILGVTFLLILRPSKKTVILIPLLSVLIYACKFSSLSVAFVSPILLLGRILFYKSEVKGKTTSNEKTDLIRYFILSTVLCSGIYLLYEFLARGNNLIYNLILLFLDIFTQKNVSQAVGSTEKAYQFFSTQFLYQNGKEYLGWLVGNQMKLLPKQVSILPRFLALPALVGLFAGLFTKRKWLSVILLSFIFSTIFLMSLFYSADARYLIVAVPSSILGVGLFLIWIRESPFKYARLGYEVLLIVFLLLYCVTQASRLKFDVMLNLKYAETPWYYLSVKTADTYLSEHKREFNKEPVIISAIPPYLLDFYAKENFIVLPLSSRQEFATHSQQAWGNYSYADLTGVYQKFFEEGNPIFLMQYGLGDVDYLHVAYDQVFKDFTLKKVQEGCYSVCDVYQITGVIKK